MPDEMANEIFQSINLPSIITRNKILYNKVFDFYREKGDQKQNAYPSRSLSTSENLCFFSRSFPLFDLPEWLYQMGHVQHWSIHRPSCEYYPIPWTFQAIVFVPTLSGLFTVLMQSSLYKPRRILSRSLITSRMNVEESTLQWSPH